jgi:hypothetical protein
LFNVAAVSFAWLRWPLIQHDQQHSTASNDEPCTYSKHSRASPYARNSTAILPGGACSDGSGAAIGCCAVSGFGSDESQQPGFRTCRICVCNCSHEWCNREFTDASCRTGNSRERHQVHARVCRWPG